MIFGTHFPKRLCLRNMCLYKNNVGDVEAYMEGKAKNQVG